MSDITSLKKHVNLKKAAGPDTVPPKLFKMCSNLTELHFCNAINYNIEDKPFPDSAKMASPRPIYKKKSRHKIENYRPISIFNLAINTV